MGSDVVQPTLGLNQASLIGFRCCLLKASCHSAGKQALLTVRSPTRFAILYWIVDCVLADLGNALVRKLMVFEGLRG